MANIPKPLDKDIFLPGKIVSLCHPNIEEDIVKGEWHTWFNNYRITELLEHGLSPLSAEEEANIVVSEMHKKSSLIFTIISNINSSLIGVISLKHINHIQRRAEIGLVTSEKRTKGAALESMALLTSHAFDRLNLQKLYAGLHEGLWKWINTLNLIGYKIEGIRRSQGYRNGNSYDVVLTGITSNDFYSLREQRNGDILNGDVVKLMINRSSINMVEKVKFLLQQL
ncbi:GNAT family N-acetyltransferase [Thermodesulfobacteriota bacterium]